MIDGAYIWKKFSLAMRKYLGTSFDILFAFLENQNKQRLKTNSPNPEPLAAINNDSFLSSVWSHSSSNFFKTR